MYLSLYHTYAFMLAHKEVYKAKRTIIGSMRAVNWKADRKNAFIHPSDFSIPQLRLYITVKKNPTAMLERVRIQAHTKHILEIHIFILVCFSSVELS